ncbi:MAG: beta strand repeat-containing protein [Limisphaerales bacterium]
MRAQLFLVAERSATNSPEPGMVALGWNPSPDTNADGYFLCWGLASGACTNLLDAGNSTNATVAGMATNVTYYFTIVAYDAAGDESPPSNEIAYPLGTVTTLGPVAPSQSYGTVTFSATLSPSTANGPVAFMDGATILGYGTNDGISGTATFTPVANQLAVNGGTAHAIQAVYSGDPLGVYAASSSYVSNLTITALPVTLSGTKIYDGTAIIPAASLSMLNNLDGANLTLSGSAVLDSRDVGSRTVVPASYAAPVRVQSATGNTGSSVQTTITVNLGSAPVNGNTLVAVISTRGTNLSRVTSITNANVTTWERAAQSANANGTTTEIWYAPVGVGNAGTAVTITQASLRSAAAVMEYSGVFTASPLDQTASATGSSATAATGTTPTTTQAGELWVGGIGLVSSNYTLTVTGTPAFNSVTNASSRNRTAGNNARVYALDYYPAAAGTASSGGTISSSSQWSGAIATFLATPSLTLAGSAAPNYTVAGVSGTVTISPTNLTVTAAANTKTYDGTTSAAATATITAGTMMSGDSAPVWTETYATKNVGTGLTLTPDALAVDDGNNGANYNVTCAQNFAGVINAANLTVTAVANTKIYDGTTSAAATPTITAGTIMSGDTAPVWTETYATQNVGTGLTLTPAGVVSDGNGGLNYNYDYVPVTSGEIDPLATATLLTSTVNPSGSGANVTFTATVTGVPPAADPPTGNVVFLANGTPFATNGPLASGDITAHTTPLPVSITASTASLPVGINTMTAQYLGDGIFQASTSGSLVQVVTNSIIYSQTNGVLSIVNNGDGTFTLNLLGTPGASYYLVVSGDASTSMAAWKALAGSTNTAPSPSGQWSIVVSNAAPAFFRSVAVNPAP